MLKSGVFGAKLGVAVCVVLLVSCKPSSMPADTESATQSQSTTVPKICEYSWEQRPGTTDYTTYDSFARRNYPNPDRPQSQTLIGSKAQVVKSLCQKAAFLKRCFDKVVTDNNSESAKAFKTWAARRGVHPVLALMAKTEQETKMGMLPDSCHGGSCNGIGIGQVITAIDDRGRVLSSSDKRWEGITYNILTNLNYSVRVLADKTGRAGTLWELAYRYNGSGHARSYADKVVQYYSKLKSCGLY